MSDSGATFASPAAVGARSLRQQIAETLQRAIISGAYRPGQRLVERRLSGQFGVSSIPVREALQDLENLGLVANKPNAGCSVVELTPDEAASICELRRLLEPKLMEWAAALLLEMAAGFERYAGRPAAPSK